MNTSTQIGLSDILLAPDWNFERTNQFMHGWVSQAFKITLGYLSMVYLGQKWMESKSALDNKAMNITLAVWNFTFSIFSGFAAYRLIPELFHTLKHFGFVGSYCYNDKYYTDPMTGYWGWMFVMSKAPELGDTLFLILRKRPVIFMHWYHHALTFLYAQITYTESQAWVRWSLALNLTVHTVMYFYFGVQALKIKTPRYVAKFITTIQITQFVISCYIFTQLVYIKITNSVPNCSASWNVLSLGALMYLSYLYLFAKFFYNAYIAKPAAANKKIQ
ncbi:GNS1/SUR4 family domain-containing protein [Ditylenchus destructor]|nr:GNS1/SUR4 family domain-containing protein [Ditylenchus destructor]